MTLVIERFGGKERQTKKWPKEFARVALKLVLASVAIARENFLGAQGGERLSYARLRWEKYNDTFCRKEGKAQND